MSRRSAQDMETWETTGANVVSVNQYDARGNTKARIAGGRPGQRVQLTHEEREDLNEDAAADASVCIFRNGYLRPVKNVPDDVLERFEKETKQVGGHTDDELVAALKDKSAAEFAVWVEQINEATLRRLAAVVSSADATVSQMQFIEDAMAKFQVTGPEGRAARQTAADKIVHAEPKQPGAPAQ